MPVDSGVGRERRSDGMSHERVDQRELMPSAALTPGTTESAGERVCWRESQLESQMAQRTQAHVKTGYGW